jgi:cell wall-associated NlpC family hydrolase
LRTQTQNPKLTWRLGGLLVLSALGLGAFASPAAAQDSGGVTDGGDTTTTTTTSGSKAKLAKDGTAIPPANAPRRVKRAIRAANDIIDKPYRYGGGHSRWRDRGYDCSGTASYALGKFGARLIKRPKPSGAFMRWGRRGKGKWITAFANRGHMFLVIAGLRLDTSMVPGNGPGWSTDVKAGKVNGPYKKRTKGRFNR